MVNCYNYDCKCKEGSFKLATGKRFKDKPEDCLENGYEIRQAMENDKDNELFTGIVESDECYIGGKPKKGDKKR